MITATPESVGLSSRRLDRINDFTSSYVDSGKVAGTVTLVARRNQVVHLQCQGKMDLESGEDMREDAIFRLHSMTKPITSVAALILYERGYFQLDTPVSNIIPEFKNLQVFESGTPTDYKTIKPSREMTVGDLLKHTSGLTYDIIKRSPVDEIYRQAGVTIRTDQYTLAEFVHKIAEMPLLFSPGTKWNYSFSTDVLGYVIEVISGQTLDVFLHQELLGPLGMVDTAFYVPLEKANRFTTLYAHKSAMPAEISQGSPNQQLFPYGMKGVRQRDSLPKTLLGGGGLLSTIGDYLQFASMLLNKGRHGDIQILSPKTVELMTSNHLPGDIRSFCTHRFGQVTPIGYGFGLGVAVMLDPTRANSLGTPGEYFWNGAAHINFFVDPKEELIGIMMTQLFPPELYNIPREFKAVVYQSIIE